MAKTTTEKIDGVQARIAQLKSEEKRLLGLQREQERKARTRRLIERGAILESMIDGADTLTNDEVKAFLAKTVGTGHAREILREMTGRSAGMGTSKPETDAPFIGATESGNAAPTGRVTG
jgi:multidrug resistance efflux pump